MTAEKQYLELLQRIMDQGVWINNKRTGKRCLTVINADIEYDIQNDGFPLCTTRKSYWKPAVAEMLGYLRGYDNAADFRELGTSTWDANANETPAWLASRYRLGEDDVGKIYGAMAKAWPMDETPFDEYARNLMDGPKPTIDLIHKVYNNLLDGIDDRREIITFYNPGGFHLGALRPCMHSHHFSILGDTLHLNSTQASCDVPLGLNFNMVQVYFLLAVMAQITGLKPGKAYHKIVNAHIYEDQLDGVMELLKRTPTEPPQLIISPDITTLEDLETWVTLDQFKVEGYMPQQPIEFPMSV